ncbi:flavin monoamine oxidase family protein [Chryseobacterium gwangjuense]|uniref:flavin monoamine oxidase family protein n=1 Tax=Chryseobacterium gwangjuense TaxID=1069980 RepID=UPI001E4D061D|nr:NAD(P)/FAD-dependent oxidoreductase [Chryseobacterium gwangjuense]MCE3077168.1 NAD(P)/FAD-dependent oxidoreductase [Chryseobacterium gwangjuense]
MTTRRSFIRQGLLAAGGLMIPSSSFANFIISGKKDVIIIGAGFSGLAAANHLGSRKFNVTVLESKNDVGGRVFSHTMKNNLIIELGAEWVGNSHQRLLQLCDEFKLKLDDNQMSTRLLYKNVYTPAKKSHYSEAWDVKLERLLQEYRDFNDDDKMILDKMDWWKYLVNNGCNERDLDLHELFDSTDFGESIRQVSANSALSEYAENLPGEDGKEHTKNQMDQKIVGGNKRLAQKLAEKLGEKNIKLNHKVIRVEQGDRVKVFCSNGEVFEADKVICTLPTFALKNIDWRPHLPNDKIEALNELQYARINKHAMLFDKRFWESEDFDLVTDQLPHYFYHATQKQPEKAGVLISYSIGDKAAVIANQSKEANFNSIQDTLRPIFGDLKSSLLQQENYYWGNDDRSKGAYALYRPGQWFRIKPILKEPFLHIHFAGEHLSENWQGFMEGAIESGEEAAEEIKGV